VNYRAGASHTPNRLARVVRAEPHVPLLVGIVPVAVAIGAGTTLLPLGAVLGAASLGLLGVGLVAVWALLRSEGVARSARVHAAGDEGRLASHVVASEPLAIQAARLLFFAGAATVSQSGWRLPGGLTVSEVLFIGAFGCSCLAVLLGRAVAILPASLVSGVAVFAIGGAMSSFAAVAPAQSAVEVVHAIYVMLLWSWTGLMVLRTRRQLIVTLLLWSFSSALNGVGALAQVAGLSNLAGPLEGHRATGFTDHPNDLGGAAAVALIPVLLLATSTALNRPGVRLISWSFVALVAASLVLSGSVAAMGAAALAASLWLASPFIGGTARMAIIVGIAIALVAVSVFGSKVDSPATRIAQVVATPGVNPDAGSAHVRLTVISTVWPRIRSNPLVGTGLGDSNLAVPVITAGVNQLEQVHGAPLAAWYEAGLFGLIGIALVFGCLLMLGWRASTVGQDGSDRAVGWALLAAFSAFIVYALSAPLFFQQYGWLIGVLIVAWSTVVGVRTPAVSGAQRDPAPAPRIGITG
jgi:hypothetical protein